MFSKLNIQADILVFISSVQLSRSVRSNSLWPHELQHARLPCPSPTPWAYLNSCPVSRWCHPTISHPLSSPSPPAFNLSQNQGLFQWVSSSHQATKVLELQLQHPVLPMNIQGWFPLGLTGLISLQSNGLSKSLLQHHSSKASIFRCSAFFMVQLSHPYMTTRKTITLTIWTFVGKVMSLLLNTLSRFVIALPYLI